MKPHQKSSLIYFIDHCAKASRKKDKKLYLAACESVLHYVEAIEKDAVGESDASRVARMQEQLDDMRRRNDEIATVLHVSELAAQRALAEQLTGVFESNDETLKRSLARQAMNWLAGK